MIRDMSNNAQKIRWLRPSEGGLQQVSKGTPSGAFSESGFEVLV
jgi:hypothetical protein